MVFLTTPKKTGNRNWTSIKKQIEAGERGDFSLWLIGKCNASSWYWISEDQDMIYSVFFDSLDSFEAEQFLSEWTERYNIRHHLRDEWSLVWYGGFTVELYFNDTLVEAFTIGMMNRKPRYPEFKKIFIEYAKDFEIQDHFYGMYLENKKLE